VVDTSRGPQRGGPHWNDESSGQGGYDPPGQYGQQPNPYGQPSHGGPPPGYQAQNYQGQGQGYQGQGYPGQGYQGQGYQGQGYPGQGYPQQQPGYSAPPPGYGPPAPVGYAPPGYSGNGAVAPQGYGQPVRQPGLPPAQVPYSAPGRNFTTPAEAYVPARQPVPAPVPVGRHAATGPEDPRARSGIVRTSPMRRKGWQWLLIVPAVLPLLVPFYDRLDPYLWGIPFFYWYQIACGLAGSLIITFVYLVTKGKA
jgi:hypothetical protein